MILKITNVLNFYILLIYKLCPIFLQINWKKIKIYYVSKTKKKNVKSLSFWHAKYSYIIGLFPFLFLEEGLRSYFKILEELFHCFPSCVEKTYLWARRADSRRGEYNMESPSLPGPGYGESRGEIEYLVLGSVCPDFPVHV